MKKTFALLLALLMLVSAIPFASAACAVCVDDNYDGLCDVCGAKTCVAEGKCAADEGSNVCGWCGKPVAGSSDSGSSSVPGVDVIGPGAGSTEPTPTPTPTPSDPTDYVTKMCAPGACKDKNFDHVCDWCGGAVTSIPSIPVTPIQPSKPGTPGKPVKPGKPGCGQHGCGQHGCVIPGCNGYHNHHSCSYKTWTYNATYHWRQCYACGKLLATIKEYHKFNYMGKCTVCGYYKTNCGYDCNYYISVEKEGAGSVTVSSRYADYNDLVVISATPSRGYDLAYVSVTTAYNREVNVTRRADGNYSFRMPQGNVYVNVVFTKEGYNPVYNTGKFYDVSVNDWFFNAVDYVTGYGIMSAYADGRFAPNVNMTRATLAVALYNLAGAPRTAATAKFNDVYSGDWYAQAVAWAASAGIIEGFNGNFNPNGSITRQDLAVMLWRYAKYEGINVETAAALNFTDAASVSAYAVDAVRWAVAMGIVNGMGDGTFAPFGTSTRAQGATMLMRFAQYAG